MKKTILAVSMAALFATSANAVEIFKSDTVNVDLYGQLRTSLKFAEHANGKLSAGSSRTGVNVSAVVTEGLTVFGGYEIGLGGNASSDDKLTNRHHVFGVDTDYGKITVGKQLVSADDVWGADYSYFYGGTHIALAEESSLGGGLHNSLIKYNAEFAGVWINANVGLDEGNANNRLYEAFVGTSFGGLSVHVGGGVDESNITTAEALGIVSGAPAVIPASTKDLKNTYAEATIEYTFDAAKIGVQYYYSELKDGTTKTDRDGYAISGTYDLTDELGLYGGFELVDKGVVNADDVDNTYLGAVYTFNKYARVFVEGAVTDGDNNLGFGGRVYW